MSRKFAALLAGALVFSSAAPSAIAGEDQKPGEAEAKAGKGDGERKPKRDKDKDSEDGKKAARAAGQPGGREAGREGGGMPWGGPGGPGGRPGIREMMSRMLGVDVDDPKAGPKMDALPLGIEKRLVLKVPVGGVDNPAGSGEGWRMETVFKMTDEQTKAVETLRDEYKTEQKKLEQEILEQQKVLAEKVKQLRLKYELRANDVLTGDDKAAKEKMDALAKETSAKNAAVVADILPLYDAKDPAQGMALIRTLREKTAANAKASETALIELIPAGNREKFQEVLTRQSEERERTNRFMQGGRGRPGGDAVKPPPPPDKPPGGGNF